MAQATTAEPMGIWESITTILAAITGTAVTITTSMDKTVKLYENEVDMLHEEQAVRLDKIAKKRDLASIEDKS